MVNAYNPSTNRYDYASNLYRTNNSTATAKAKNVIAPTIIISKPADTRAESAQFLNQYKYQMEGLSSAANKLRSLNKDGLWNDISAQSSDTDVAEAELRVYTESKLGAKADYKINVMQMAEAQIVQSEGVKADAKTAFTDGNIAISMANGKSVDVSVVTTDKDGNTRTNQEVQADIVSQINAAGVGLKASIIEEKGKGSSIRIESETGTANSFTVDPGTTRVQLNTTQEAQNLKYSVEKDGKQMNGGMVYQKASNQDVYIDGPQMTVDFKKTGNVAIKVGVDNEKITKATEEFVNQYNKTLELLVDNAHRGTGTSKTLSDFTRSPISKDAMELIGITREENGRFTLDKEKFSKALDKKPREVYDILSDNYSIADGVYQDTKRGLSQPASKLVGNDMERIIYSQLQMQPISFDYGRYGLMNDAYSRAFFFNMMA